MSGGALARCLVTRRLPGGAVDRLAAEHEVEVWPHAMPPPRTELLRLVGGCEGLLCLLTDRVDAELLDAAPRLRAVANMAVGVDNVDLAETRRRRIPVGNTPGVLTDSTADLTMALILAAARRLVEGREQVLGGGWRTWDPMGLLGLELRGAVLGIVGMGRIGRAVARRAAGFGMRVDWCGRDDPAGLDRLLAESDVVSLHCPLTAATRHLIGRDALARMKPGAILVNTARGPIVDQDALREALRAGRIGAAALDVTDPEPLPADDPLLAAPNLLVVPHIGSATHTARGRMADLAVDNLLAALAGRPMPHPV
jgi:glyoxylate reductase